MRRRERGHGEQVELKERREGQKVGREGRVGKRGKAIVWGCGEDRKEGKGKEWNGGGEDGVESREEKGREKTSGIYIYNTALGSTHPFPKTGNRT